VISHRCVLMKLSTSEGARHRELGTFVSEISVERCREFPDFGCQALPSTGWAVAKAATAEKPRAELSPRPLESPAEMKGRSFAHVHCAPIHSAGWPHSAER
jgi:hypothetical protein